jgi:hypothetical protein
MGPAEGIDEDKVKPPIVVCVSPCPTHITIASAIRHKQVDESVVVVVTPRASKGVNHHWSFSESAEFILLPL